MTKIVRSTTAEQDTIIDDISWTHSSHIITPAVHNRGSTHIGGLQNYGINTNNKENYILEIIGGSTHDSDNLKNTINELKLSNSIKVSPWIDRKLAAKKLSEATFGLLINTPNNDHSYLYTSPLKYFEYLYSGLSVVAVDFPSHRTLPINEKISFFENGNKESFINSLKNSKNNKPLSEDEKHLITLARRAEQLIKYIF